MADAKRASKDDRLFAPFPIEMDEHPKIIGLSDAAFRAVFEATFYSRRMLSDGFLDERVVLRRWGQQVADELGANDPNRPSWIRVENGWQIHDFSKHHPTRAEIEEKRADTSAKRSEAGSKGAAKRWQADSKTMANDSSETETETETRTTSPSVSEPQFDSAYSHWPKKINRKQAFERFKTAAKKRGADLLLADIARFGDAYARTTETKYVPALGVWLNAERWTDELPGGVSPTQSVNGRREEIRDGIKWVNGKPVVGGRNGMTPEQYERWSDERANGGS